MDNKRSIGITIISGLEIVVGALGIIFAIPFLSLFIFKSEPVERADGLAIAISLGIPALVMFAMGELTFHLKPAGRILHLIIPIIVIILFSFQFMKVFYSLLMPDLSMVIVLLLIALFLFPIYYLPRPKVKEQFK